MVNLVWGMGLGSLRPVLDDKSRFHDFDLRKYIGKDRPFFGNLGIAQIEKALEEKSSFKIHDLISKLDADGLVIHVNPLQEYLQPEGDRFKRPPIETIEEFLEQVNYQIIVKEVGQGMGKRSLKALLQLPIDALELAAFGGTNFSKLELLRSDEISREVLQDFIFVGHSASEMISEINLILSQGRSKCDQFILSGGIESLLDGFYLGKQCQGKSIIGMASRFLKYARKGESQLSDFIKSAKKKLGTCQINIKLEKRSKIETSIRIFKN